MYGDTQNAKFGACFQGYAKRMSLGGSRQKLTTTVDIFTRLSEVWHRSSRLWEANLGCWWQAVYAILAYSSQERYSTQKHQNSACSGPATIAFSRASLPHSPSLRNQTRSYSVRGSNQRPRLPDSCTWWQGEMHQAQRGARFYGAVTDIVHMHIACTLPPTACNIETVCGHDSQPCSLKRKGVNCTESKLLKNTLSRITFRYIPTAPMFRLCKSTFRLAFNFQSVPNIALFDLILQLKIDSFSQILYIYLP